MDMELFILGHVILFAISCGISFNHIFRGDTDVMDDGLLVALMLTIIPAIPFFALFEIVYWGLHLALIR